MVGVIIFYLMLVVVDLIVVIMVVWLFGGFMVGNIFVVYVYIFDIIFEDKCV